MSLSQQLAAISGKTASVVLDRKSRSKVHSKSLIFDPKTASTQDYDAIYSIAIEGLEQLIEIDSRFERFTQSLFSETTINFDRNVQDPEMLKQLNTNIEAFLILASPYYLLNPTLRAVEWLVRRFNINIHNGEMMLLTTLPYYKYPVFVKVLNVIPKNQFPKIFQWLMGFKENLKSPSNSSILKGFHGDFEMFHLYSLFIVDQIKNKTLFSQQLVFYLSVSIQILASHAKDPNSLLETHLPLYLEVVAKLLLPNKALSNDLKLTAYSIISVMNSILPLSPEIIVSLSESILSDDAALSSTVAKQTVVTLGQLWNKYTGESQLFAHLAKLQSTLTAEFLTSLKEEDYCINKLLVYYFASNLSQSGVTAVLKSIDLSNNNSFQILGASLLEKAFEKSEETTRTNVTNSIEHLYKQDKLLFVEILQNYKPGLKVSELEMVLMISLESEEETHDADVELEDELEDADDAEESDPSFESLKTSTVSFLTASSTEEFFKLSAVLVNKLRGVAVKQQRQIIRSFSSTIFKNQETAVSFLLRLSMTPSLPSISRLTVLLLVKQNLNKIAKSSEKVDLYLLVPVILLGLYDNNGSIRVINIEILKIIKTNTERVHKESKVNASLFMEDQIYSEIPKNKRAIIAPKDALFLLQSLVDDGNLEDLKVDRQRLLVLLEKIFTLQKSGSKKFGQLLVKSFLLSQWASPAWSLTLKSRCWKIVSIQNKEENDNRLFFEADITNYLSTRDAWKNEAEVSKIDFHAVEKAVVGLVGGTVIDKSGAREVDWFISGLSESAPGNLQLLVSDRLEEVFQFIKSNDLKLKLVSKVLDSLVNDDVDFEYDPYLLLQTLDLGFTLFMSVLSTVQIVSQIPDQSASKRRRRSSSQTRQNMARSDISNIAANHLRKLTTVLDLLEYNLDKKSNDIACPELLVELFKVLTDLDHLGNEGNLPVLYAQESLASCMLISIRLMKNNDKGFRFDSNSIRAYLIVNSIRNSQSPQVQNKLLLVIAELASLAPEIILHSVMPIFTFMGAHTIRQDDEFSNAALQETVSKVIPALAQNGATNVNDDIEFLLASFVAALQHIPGHRRTKLFTSLVKTLTIEKSLHVILFLVGSQYSLKLKDGKTNDSGILVSFVNSLLKNFTSAEQLKGISKFLLLWKKIPNVQVAQDSDEYEELAKRPVFGTQILALADDELTTVKASLLGFINEIIQPNDEFNEINLMKLKIGMVLMDDDVSEADKKDLLKNFNDVVSFLLTNIENYTNTLHRHLILDKLYELMGNLLDNLPISYFIDSVIDSLDANLLQDGVSIKVAKNFTKLLGKKFELELSVTNTDEKMKDIVISKLLPILLEGIDKNLDLELEQAYLDAFATVISKVNNIDSGIFTQNKFLIDSLAITTGDKCFLSNKPELVISSINVIINTVNILGVKAIGYFPKIITPSFKIWEDAEANESGALVQTSVLLMFSSLIKKLPAFITSNLDTILITILTSDQVDNEIRSGILSIVVEHMDSAQLLKSLCNIWMNKSFFENDDADNIGLYTTTFESTVEKIDKKQATSNSGLFVRWLIKCFEFRNYCETEDKFNNNTIHRVESSFHKIAIGYVMKLNDKNFRPLFASLARWAFHGEGSSYQNNEASRLVAFFRFFNKLQEELKSIITSYYSYLIEPVSELLQRFASGTLVDTNLRRIVLMSVNSGFKFDQDDYWTQESRFEMIHGPLIGQLANIEDSIGKYLVKAITSFTATVSSEDYNVKIIGELLRFVSNEHDDNSAQTKIWTVRTLKNIFQKLGEQWLSHLPTLVPYISELLEDDHEEVEMEVRKGLVRVIENVLGEPLDRYLD